MNIKTLPSFILLVIIPTFVFFIYAYIKIGDASSAIISQSEIKKIVTNKDDYSYEFTQQPSQIKAITDAVYSSLNITEDSNFKVTIAPEYQARSLLNNLSRVSSVLTTAGYSEGDLFERVNNMASTIKEVSIKNDNQVNDKKQTVWRAIWQVDENTYDVFFGINNNSITPPVEFALRRLLNENVKSGKLSVHLSGFADRIGVDIKNCRLAKNRLKKVEDFIVKDFSNFQITTTASGELRVPFYPEKDGLIEPRNRIVRIYFKPNSTEFYGPACIE